MTNLLPYLDVLLYHHNVLIPVCLYKFNFSAMIRLCLSMTGVLLSFKILEASNTPNIILIMADDLGWGDVGFNGNTIIKTPCLDSLTSEGIIFDRFYAGSAVSSPTRASVLTGRNPFRTGVFHANEGILRTEEITLPELLMQRGYGTGHFGKWHLGTLTYTEKDANRGCEGNKSLYNPPSFHGYNESFATESKVPTYDPMMHPEKCNGKFWDYLKEGDKTRRYGTYYWKHNGDKETENLSGDDSRVIMDRVIPFIDRSIKEDRPFFSAIWFHTPHLPCVAGPEHSAMYKDYSLEERNYYGCITAMDEQIGRLVDYLKENDLFENTVICFCSDNGPVMDLRGRKRDFFEGGIRVPGFIVYPDMIKGNQRTEHVASTFDLLPTFVDLLKLPTPPNEIDGESLIPFLTSGAERKKPLVYAIKSQGAVVEQKYKLVYNKGEYFLFNIEKDKSEKNNICDKKKAVFKRLSKILDDALDEYHKSFIGEEYGYFSFKRVKQSWVKVK